MGTLFPPEALDPELEACVLEGDVSSFPMLKHPLVFSVPYSPQLNTVLNKQLRAKRQRIASLEGMKDYEAILWFYERPYRLDALLFYAGAMTDTEYWSSLGELWTDTENLYQNEKLWKKAVTSKRSGRDALMSETDLAMYNSLPEQVTIYRGQLPKYRLGMSWTTDLEKATWFAKRFNRGGVVRKLVVDKSSILFCKASRGESEVVIIPNAANCTEVGGKHGT